MKALRIGLPYSSWGVLARAAAGLHAPTLISAGSMYRKGRGFTPIGRAAWLTPSALDCGGFTAMLLGGYRWSLSDYVEFVVTNSGNGAMPFPWDWWAAMDYCCEPEIAHDWAEIVRRVELTVQSYYETLDELEWWRGEGVNDVPDPMPTLQGRTAEDYLSCAAYFHELPSLVGIGSVCRRKLHGPDGLLPILEVLHAELPSHVQLHLFGVKGPALPHLQKYGSRIASTDSMAWDFRAKHVAKERGERFTKEIRAECMHTWYTNQMARLSPG